MRSFPQDYTLHFNVFPRIETESIPLCDMMSLFMIIGLQSNSAHYVVMCFVVVVHSDTASSYYYLQ